jgi:VanZ family protein
MEVTPPQHTNSSLRRLTVMKASLEQGPWPPLKFRWLIWFAFLGGWSAALLSPVPEGIKMEVAGYDLRFIFAKTVHVCAYAAWAVLSGWLLVSGRFRWLLMLLMAGHAAGSEYLQQFVGRGMSVRDVVLDLIGVTLGCLLTWKWWCDPS